MPGKARQIICFGGPRGAPLEGLGPVARRRRLSSVRELAIADAVGALVLDARTPRDLERAAHLLRALYDDPRHPARVLHPGRVLALIAPGDVEAAFAFGRYGIAGVVEDGAPELAARVRRIADAEPEALPLPAGAALRDARLGPRPDGALPTVALAYRHAPETLDLLERYQRTLRERAAESTVYADVALLFEVLVREGLTVQTRLATKAGATHGGQFIGSFDYYRQLRRTRYGAIPDCPDPGVPMDVFIAVDEILHEVLHLLYLANERRAGIAPTHPQIAEELALTWWQAVVHRRVFPAWIQGSEILHINDDFALNERNQEGFHFWRVGHVFSSYAHLPWVPHVLAQLPERAAYLGPRADFDALARELEARPDAAFLLPTERLRMEVPGFAAYPSVGGLAVRASPRRGA